jgi:hypothetical protein
MRQMQSAQKVRILTPGRKIDEVAYRCDGCRRRGHAFRAAFVVSLMLLSTPPSSNMNWRRFIRSPRRHGRARSAARQDLVPWRSSD